MPPTLEQATRARLSEIRDLARSGITELTGRAIRAGGSEGAFVGRIGGLKPMYPELFRIPDSPKQIAAAIDRGEGKVFRRVYATVERAMGREGFQPQRKRTTGRPTVHPHEGRPYCHACREWHAKGQHRSHGPGSFHRTHLWGFSLGNPSPMTKDAARRVFAELMKKARERRLTEKEHAQLRTASQIIRYEKRRGFTGAVNPRRKKKHTTWPHKLRGGIPRWLREQLGFASDAINAYLRGMSIPQVALRYRYEPIQAMTMIRTMIADFGLQAIAQHVPKHVLSVVQSKYPDTNPRRRGRQRKLFGERESGYPRRRARSNRASPGLLRMGKLVELRYYRDWGKKQGYYKHKFENASPTVYYDPSKNIILAR